jgi:thiamine-phosphate pyrophosphorylase
VAPSISKPGHAPRQSLQELAELTRRVPLPIIALGGVTAANARPLVEAGFAGVAVTGAVMAAPDPAAAVRALMAALTCSTESA